MSRTRKNPPWEVPSAALGQVPEANKNAKACFLQAYHEEHHLLTSVWPQQHLFPSPCPHISHPDTTYVPIFLPPSAGRPWPCDSSHLFTWLIVSCSPFTSFTGQGMVMFHEDLPFSKSDMQGREGKVWTNKIWELCSPFLQGFQIWLLYYQVCRAMITTFQSQSPSKPVNLNFSFTL